MKAIKNNRGVLKVSYLFVILLFLLCIGSVSAEDTNVTKEKQQAQDAIDNIETIMGNMEEKNFSVQRINDTLKEAKQIYEAQLSREEKGRTPDYSQIKKYEEEIKNVRDNAFEAKDKYYSLKKGLKKLKEDNINASEAEELVNKVKQEIEDERYEEALDIVPEARKKISEIRASNTALRTFYSATTSSIKDFFINNYKKIAIIVAVLIISFLFLRKRIMIYLKKRKIKRLKLEKKTINNLIKKTQREYFEKGSIPQHIYEVRTNKYAELIRDINRKIPLLEESITRLKKGKSVKKDKKGKKRSKKSRKEEIEEIKNEKEKKYKKSKKSSSKKKSKKGKNK